jgi:L,D-peptidoglycan transpeptidase YkuD (ErfK/YbiS/YcfS/YnhG family)
VQIGKATSGCVSLRRPTLIHVLRWLRPSSLPYIAIAG